MITALALTLAAALVGPEAASNPVELGDVAWIRDFDAGKAESKRTGRPLLLLFQEVPGCEGCVNFGAQVLTHPLIVEAMETEFVPVAIHNNKPGADDAVRKAFDEPAWNYPVLRFFGGDGEELLPRKDQVFDPATIVTRMTDALAKAKRPVPVYLQLLKAELAPAKKRTATFAMHCYWEGEADLGSIRGVISTRSAWRDGLEVVIVEYDEAIVSYDRLVRQAAQFECASRVYAHDAAQLDIARARVGERAVRATGEARDAKASDQTFALNRTEWRYLPLTRTQATKINGDLRRGRDASRWLSPGQRTLLGEIRARRAAEPDAFASLRPERASARLAAYARTLRQALAAPIVDAS